MHAYVKTWAYVNDAPAPDIARAEQPYFLDIDESVLTRCISAYEQLSCRAPNVRSRKWPMRQRSTASSTTERSPGTVYTISPARRSRWSGGMSDRAAERGRRIDFGGQRQC